MAAGDILVDFVFDDIILSTQGPAASLFLLADFLLIILLTLMP